VISGVGNVLGAVATGLPVEVAKEVALAIVRRARLGSAVEDALENFQGPPPQAPDPGQQLEATKQQILDLIKSEGEKQVREKDALAEHQAGLQQYDAQIQQTLGQVGMVAQSGAEQTQQVTQAVGQAAQMNHQALAQLGQLMQQFTQVVAGMQQTMQQVVAAVSAPKKVTFTKGADGRIAGATASIQ
jgi:methyl-accepting chemotaxis protein